MMGGKIVVQSKYGLGSKFTIYIAQQIKSFESIKKELEELKTNTFDNKRILLVDDNKLNLKIATRLLSEYNINVDAIESGFVCLDKIKDNEKYDLILLDDMMPKMSGTETLHNLRLIENFDIDALTEGGSVFLDKRFVFVNVK